MLPPYYFYWFRIDNKHMTEPWLDQALMDSSGLNKKVEDNFVFLIRKLLYCKQKISKSLSQENRKWK